MPASVRLRINHARVRAVVGPMAKSAVSNAANISAGRYRANITGAGLVDTGGLLASVTTRDATTDPLKPRYAVGAAAKHAKWLERGTRGHGPVRAKALRFRPKGSSRFVYAKWVRGVRAYRFAARTLDQVRPTDFT